MKKTQINQMNHPQTNPLNQNQPNNTQLTQSSQKSPNSILFKKYSSFYYSYDNIQISNLIFNEKCRVVGIFKDYLILDDNTEFLRRYYTNEENPPRLSRIFSFYETYSKIFPNYMILPESAYLYRNIRKKQKMIDAFNQIKREEEENRLNLNLEKKTQKNGLIIFGDSLQESIQRYAPSLNRSKGFVDDTLNSFSISVSMRKLNNHDYISASPTQTIMNEESNVSIVLILNNMNKPIETEEFIAETPKKIKKIDYIPPVLVTKNDGHDKGNDNQHQQTLSALNNNRKFISHKAAVSVPEIQNNSKNNNKEIKIINNYHNIIVPQGGNTVININTHYYQTANETNSNKINHSNSNTNSNKNSNTNATAYNSTTTHVTAAANPFNKKETKSISPNQKTQNYLNKDPIIISSRHKSFKQTNANQNIKKTSTSKSNYQEAKSLKKEHMTIEKKAKEFGLGNSFKSPEKKLNDFPISLSKNKTKTADSGNHMMAFYKNKQIASSTLSELQSKVNPFKLKFQRKYQLMKSKKKKSSFSSSKKSYDTFNYKKKEIKITLLTEEDKEKELGKNKNKDKITDDEPIFIHTEADQKMTQHEMKQRAKKDAITMRISCDSNRKQTNVLENRHRYPSSNTFTFTSSQRKDQNVKHSFPKKLLLSPNNNNNYNTVETKVPLATKVMLNPKIVLKKETQNIKHATITSTNAYLPSKVIKSINFKSLDANTKKMKFIKK